MQPCKAEALKHHAGLGLPAWFIPPRHASSGGITYMTACWLQPCQKGLTPDRKHCLCGTLVLSDALPCTERDSWQMADTTKGKKSAIYAIMSAGTFSLLLVGGGGGALVYCFKPSHWEYSVSLFSVSSLSECTNVWPCNLCCVWEDCFLWTPTHSWLHFVAGWHCRHFYSLAPSGTEAVSARDAWATWCRLPVWFTVTLCLK